MKSQALERVCRALRRLKSAILMFSWSVLSYICCFLPIGFCSHVDNAGRGFYDCDHVSVTTARSEGEWISALKQRPRWRRGRRLVKKKTMVYKRNSQMSRFVRYANGSKRVFKLNMQRRRSIPKLAVVLCVPWTTQKWSFDVFVLQRTAKKCTKIYNARA